MDNWLAYPAFGATAISIICLSYLAIKGHERENPRTLSIVAAASPTTLLYFRLVLWTCATLFAITMYGYVIPNIKFAGWQGLAWSITYIPELILALLPAKGRTLRAHSLFAMVMGIGMLSSAWLFVFSVSASLQVYLLAIAVIMSLMGLLTFIDKSRYIIYELSFIYLAHISIVLTVFSLMS